MTMPIDLVLVRHGESEGNLANKFSRLGDNRHFTPEFTRRTSAMWRLTDKGRRDAGKAGQWIRDNIGAKFGRYYVSEYIRAQETAALLNLPDAQWYAEFYLRERDWGEMEVLADDERQARFAESLRRREVDSFYWTPPNGESLAQLCLRIDRIINTLHRECSEKRVIIVCHGEVMWAFRVRLERMSQMRFRELDESTNPHNRIHNCQILHYTRCDPCSDVIAAFYSWMRSVCPMDTDLSSNEWQEIKRPRYSNSDLLTLVGTVPRLVNE